MKFFDISFGVLAASFEQFLGTKDLMYLQMAGENEHFDQFIQKCTLNQTVDYRWYRKHNPRKASNLVHVCGKNSIRLQIEPNHVEFKYSARKNSARNITLNFNPFELPLDWSKMKSIKFENCKVIKTANTAPCENIKSLVILNDSHDRSSYISHDLKVFAGIETLEVSFYAMMVLLERFQDQMDEGRPPEVPNLKLITVKYDWYQYVGVQSMKSKLRRFFGFVDCVFIKTPSKMK